MKNKWLARVALLGIVLAACGAPTPTPDAAVTDASATPDGGEPSDGGTAPGPCEGGCLIGEVCYPDGVADPTNPCQACDASLSSTAFTPRDGGRCDDGSFCTVDDSCSAGVCAGAARSCDDGIACNGAATCDEDADACMAGAPTCGSGELCDGLTGACVAACLGCSIDGVCYGDGQVDPLSPCQVCDVDASRAGWTANDGATCDDGDFCTVSDVCAAGTCGGTTPRECSDGVACNGVEACDEASDACVAGTGTCAAAEICDVASDSCTATCTGCVIDGTCFGAGQRNPAAQCEVCAPASSTSSWSANDGARCDDGLFCTVDDVCDGTSCDGGAARECSDGIDCNGSETCDETAGACAPGTTTCGAGALCDPSSDACVTSCSGCVIDGVCYGEGQPSPSNPCEICDVATSASSWSANDGARCDDGSFCTVSDVCSARTCAGTPRDCGDGVACNGAETCDEASDACAPGAATCAATEVCDVASGACVTTCAGCVVAGVCHADGSLNPASPCEICDPSRSRSSFSANTGASCDDGSFCTTGDVCAGTVCAGSSATNFCDDGVACNGAETCNEGADRCASGASTCAAGQVCDPDADACLTTCGGCVIGGVCYAPGSTNGSNPCQVCDVASSTSAWTANTGARCDDGSFCTTGDVCAGTVCAGSSATNFCDDGVACNGAETCNEGVDRCASGASTCTGGLICDGPTDSCVLSCAGGTTRCGSTCVETDNDPLHCGGCGIGCPDPAGATPVCVAGACRAVCDAGFGDCDGDPVNGCIPLADDELNCGACGVACGGLQVCMASTCIDARLVFVTSETFVAGSLGSLANADAHCQRLATEAARPGTYKAWLSDTTVSAAARFTHSTVPYMRVDGVIVADDWTDLTDGTLDATISVNERGGGPPGSPMPIQCRVATGTMASGGLFPVPDAYVCGNWTNPGVSVLAGNPTVTDQNWSQNCGAGCSNSFALYCFQQ